MEIYKEEEFFLDKTVKEIAESIASCGFKGFCNVPKRKGSKP
ncbi:hypothetical protein AB8U03_15285 [Clostridium sp. Mt-5]|uniref:Uncharacterized protein n=1 Tax=Clostridium moutaii TaxID=3240932 RepID=A0ABV4BSR6_9CLOT